MSVDWTFDAMSRNVDRTAPSSTWMVPAFSTTNTRVVSPSGAVTYTGAAKSPTFASVTVAACAAPGTTTRAEMARTRARRTAA